MIEDSLAFLAVLVVCLLGHSVVLQGRCGRVSLQKIRVTKFGKSLNVEICLNPCYEV